jgi:Cu/Ag efflux protein CusF
LPTTVDQSTPTPVALAETLIAHLPTEDPAAPQVDIVEYRRTSLNGRAGVALKNVEVNGKDLTLSHNCLVALNWPVQTYIFPIYLMRVICL